MHVLKTCYAKTFVNLLTIFSRLPTLYTGFSYSVHPVAPACQDLDSHWTFAFAVLCLECSCPRSFSSPLQSCHFHGNAFSDLYPSNYFPIALQLNGKNWLYFSVSKACLFTPLCLTQMLPERRNLSPFFLPL
jgi:hypothetical protein